MSAVTVVEARQQRLCQICSDPDYRTFFNINLYSDRRTILPSVRWTIRSPLWWRHANNNIYAKLCFDRRTFFSAKLCSDHRTFFSTKRYSNRRTFLPSVRWTIRSPL
jgi:hypothetical protein